MRDPDFFYRNDPKHFKQSCIARFASNIKNALNQAYGKQRHYKTTHNSANNYNNQSGHAAKNHSMPPDARGMMDMFKTNLLKSITEAFERATF